MGYVGSLVRFEGVDGSLKMTSQSRNMEEVPTLFGEHSALFSFAPHLNGVRELQLAGCFISSWLDVDHLAMAMPNLASISLFHCDHNKRDMAFRLVSGSGRGPRPPFPRLEHLTVLEPGIGLMEVCRERKKRGSPL